MDFAKLTRLSIENPEAFEIERSKILGDFIRSLPEEKRKSAYLFQQQLDDCRPAMTSSEFLQHCITHMQSNIDKIEDMTNEAIMLITDAKRKN